MSHSGGKRTCNIAALAADSFQPAFRLSESDITVRRSGDVA
jgi:hypothetical protein